MKNHKEHALFDELNYVSATVHQVIRHLGLPGHYLDTTTSSTIMTKRDKRNRARLCSRMDRPNGRISLFEGLGAPSLLRLETTTQPNFGVDLGMRIIE